MIYAVAQLSAITKRKHDKGIPSTPWYSGQLLEYKLISSRITFSVGDFNL
jgi:hypothetical protein